MKKMIHVTRPSIRRKDLEYVLECMIEEKLEYGDFARKFEIKLAEKLGIYKCIALNSYSSAIELIFKALQIKSNDEIMLPSFAPRIYLDAVLNIGAKPVLIDLKDQHSLQPSLEEIQKKTTAQTKALLLFYHFGLTYDVTPYENCVPYLIEDISSVPGALINDYKAGTKAHFTVMDLSSKQVITTGNGGAVFCNNRKSYQVLKNLIDLGKPIDPEQEGQYQPLFSGLLPDLNAAMGVSQLENFTRRLELRKKIGQIYEEAIQKSQNSYIQNEEEHDHLYSDFLLILKKSLKDAVLFFKKNHIEAIRPFDYPLHHYLKLPRQDFSNTEKFYLKSLLIPIHSSLLKKEVDHIAKALVSLL